MAPSFMEKQRKAAEDKLLALRTKEQALANTTGIVQYLGYSETGGKIETFYPQPPIPVPQPLKDDDVLVAIPEVDLTNVEFKNLILNGDMETWIAGTSTQPSEWSDVGTPTIVQDTAKGGSGDYSLKITATGAANEGSSQTISGLAPDTKYYLRCTAKCTYCNTARMFTTGAEQNADIETEAVSWVNVQTFFVTDDSATDIVVNLVAKTSGDVVWFDDVQVTLSSSKVGFQRDQSSNKAIVGLLEVGPELGGSGEKFKVKDGKIISRLWVENEAPEIRIIDSTDDEYSRWYRDAGVTRHLAQVLKPTSSTYAAYVQDEGTDGVTSAPHADFAMSGDYSIEAWLNESEFKSGLASTFGGVSLYASSTNFISIDGYDSGWQLEHRTTVGGSTIIYDDTGTTPDVDTFYHIVGVRDGATLKLYVNAVLQGDTDTDANNMSGAVNVNIGGGGPWSPPPKRTLKVAEVRIYKGRVLTQADVTAHYNNGIGLYGTDITNMSVGYHMDDPDLGGVDPVVDYSGNGHTGAKVTGTLGQTGIVAIGTTTEIEYIHVAAGSQVGEEGVVTFGHEDGRTVIHGNPILMDDLSLTGTLYADTIAEYTAAAGVTIDSVLLKDNTVLAGTLLLGAGSITDSSGAISFGDENLTTTGHLSCLNFTNAYHYTGFPNRDDTSLAWDDGAYTLTLTATDDKIWIAGVEYNINTLTKQLSVGQEGTSGLYWFWITAPGGTPQINTSTTVPDIGAGGANAGFDQVLVAAVYWNTSTSLGLLTDERHWFGRDAWMHEYLHETVSARYYEGLGGTFDDTTLTIEAGEFYDEDIEHKSIQETVCTVLYHNGDADWAWMTGQTTPYKVVNPGVNDTLQYNNGNALVNADNNKYVNYWVFISPDLTDPVWVVIGTQQHTLLSAAMAETPPNLGVLPSAEAKLIYKILYRNVGGTPDYIDVADYRASSVLPGGTGILDHGSMAGLGDDDHMQYILHSLADAASDFLVASGDNVFARKTLADTGALLEGDMIHDNLQSVPADDHVAHSGVTFSGLANNGIGGGGTIAANRTFSLDIDGMNEIGAALTDADTFPVDDGDGGTNKKCLMSRLATYAVGAVVTADNYIKNDANDTTTGNLGILKADPEMRLTDTGDSLWTRLTRSDTASVSRRRAHALEPTDIGYAVAYNGSNEYAEDASQPVSAYPFTMATWFNTTSNGGANGEIYFGLYDASAHNVKYHIFMGGSGHGAQGSIGIEAMNTSSKTAFSSGTYYDGEWHLAVAVFTSATDRKLYIDDMVNEVASDTDSVDFNTDVDVYTIGVTGDASRAGWANATIDEVSLWSIALSEADRQGLWYEGSGQGMQNVQSGDQELLLHCDTGSGDTLFDTAGNSLDATLFNTPTWVTGRIPVAGTDSEVDIWKIQDGVGLNEEGIITWGDPEARLIIEAQETRFHIGGVEQLRLDDGEFLPFKDDDINIGSASKQFKDVYCDGTLYLDAVSATSAATVWNMRDNTTAALDITQGANSYIAFNTNNGAESVVISKALTAGTIGCSSLTATGSIIATGGGETGKFLTGLAGNTVFAFSGDSFDIRAGSGGASEQNVLRVTSAGNFDFYDGNITTTGTLGCGAFTATLPSAPTFTVTELDLTGSVEGDAGYAPLLTGTPTIMNSGLGIKNAIVLFGIDSDPRIVFATDTLDHLKSLYYDLSADTFIFEDDLTVNGTITIATTEALAFADGGSATLIATTVGDPGSDTTLVSEQGIREAFDDLGTPASNDAISTPINWNMVIAAPDAVGQGTWIISGPPSDDFYNGILYNSTGAAGNGDNFTMNFRCPAGTYTLRFGTFTNPNRGVVDVYIDAGEEGSFDNNAASTRGVVREIAGLVLAAGAHTLKFQVDGKTGTNYYFDVNGINLQRTA